VRPLIRGVSPGSACVRVWVPRRRRRPHSGVDAERTGRAWLKGSPTHFPSGLAHNDQEAEVAVGECFTTAKADPID